MPSKSLKTTFKLPSPSLDEAVVYLSERFLRAARGLRVVKSPSEFCLLTLCRPLVDRWFGGQLSYRPGQVTLVFHDDALSSAADILMYVPERGDRFLYTKPHLDPPLEAPHDAPSDAFALESLLRKLEQLESLVAAAISPPAEPSSTAPNDPEALLGALSQAFQSSSRPMLSAVAQLTDRVQRVEAMTQALSTQQQALAPQLQQILSQLVALSDAGPPVPQTDDEWRSRIEDTRGTVGDYETYSAAYREMHGDAPLFDTPDWVMLCEFDWAQRLCPTLADLYKLLYGADGVGDEGADILQQFGAHCRGAERYYLYEERGYQAEAALQEIAHHPDYAWLPILRQLWQTPKASVQDILDLFGWEAAAVAALKDLATPSRYQDDNGNSGRSPSGRPPSDDSAHREQWSTAPVEPSLQDHQARLNIGPFAPLTAETVKRAYRREMKKAHPDSGGSTHQAQQVNEAYQAVMRHYFPDRI